MLQDRNAGRFGSPTRGVFGGGPHLHQQLTNTIDYVTIASTGDAVDFGDLTANRNIGGIFKFTRGYLQEEQSIQH